MADAPYDISKHLFSHGERHPIAGTATSEQKEAVYVWLDVVSQGFAGQIMRKVIVTRYNVDDLAYTTNAINGNSDSEKNGSPSGPVRGAELTCELTVDKGEFVDPLVLESTIY